MHRQNVMRHLFNLDLDEDNYGIVLPRKKLAEAIHIMLCLEVILAFSYFGYICIDPVSITTLQIPILISAIWLGPLPAVSMAFVFSVTSMWIAEVTAQVPVDIILAPSRSGNPLGSIIMNFGARMLFAVIASYVWRYSIKHTPKDKRFVPASYVCVFIVSAALNFVHILLLSGFMNIFFPEVLADTIENDIWTIVTTNILPYMIVGAVTAFAYYIPHNKKINTSFNKLCEYNRRVEKSYNRNIGFLLLALIAMICAIFINYVDNVIISADVAGYAGVDLSIPIENAIHSFIAFTCLVIMVCIITEWVSQYHSYDAMLAQEKAAQEAERAKNIAENASSSKSSFLFNMSHDIRTPMNAISGYTRLAKEHIDNSTAVAGYLDKIDISNKHLLDLINDILDVGRIESGSVKITCAPFNVIDCASEVATIVYELASEKNIEFTADINYDPSTWINADRNHLKQVIMNILSNAIKYTPPGGKIHVKMEQPPSPDPTKSCCRYTVSDTGIGMSEDFLKIIFDPYTRNETRKSAGIQGTGLGMFIVKRLIDMMGGTIDIQSELGKGTTVTIAYCFDRAEPVCQEADDKVDVEMLKDKYILLVDDNDMNREIATEILRDFDVKVDEAVDGEDAIGKTLESVKSGKRYDLILMDIQMPGLDGYETTAAIHELPEMAHIHIPIVAMTANAFDEDIKKALDSGMDAHLSKPIDIKKLVTTICEITNNI